MGKNEDYILKRAKEILDRREDEEARKMAERIETPKVNMRLVGYWSAYLHGAMNTALRLIERYGQKNAKGDDKVYQKAELELITKNVRSIELFLDRGYDMRYRNHERDKKGRLTRCEAYFVRRTEPNTEVK